MKQSLLQRYAIWLLPASSEQDELWTWIQALSTRFGTVPFSPHLTLFAGINKPPHILQTAVETGCRDVAPLTLMSTGLKVSPAFFQTLFVEFAPHPGLSALAEQLRQALDPSSPRPFHPHLSLLYHDLPCAEKETLRAALRWEPRPIRFDAVSVVFPPDGERGWYDLAGWKTMSVQPLWTKPTSV